MCTHSNPYTHLKPEGADTVDVSTLGHPHNGDAADPCASNKY